MTGQQFLMNARQSRLAALQSLQGGARKPRMSAKVAQLQIRLVRDWATEEEMLFDHLTDVESFAAARDLPKRDTGRSWRIWATLPARQHALAA